MKQGSGELSGGFKTLNHSKMFTLNKGGFFWKDLRISSLKNLRKIRVQVFQSKHVFLLVMVIAQYSCSKNITTTIAKTMVPLDYENAIHNDFEKLEKYITHKDIIFLGEASHGDGKTFEVKVQLLRYLVEEKGYNTIALENIDFIEMEYINGRTALKDLLYENVETQWFKNWNPWSLALQMEPFENIVVSSNLSLIGLETFKQQNLGKSLIFIKSVLENSDYAHNNIDDWTALALIFDQLILNDNQLSIAQYEYFISKMDYIKSINEDFFFEDDFFLQMLDNLLTYIKIDMFPTIYKNEEDVLVATVNERDHQMARNLIYFKERNPESKIIVWLANFHGATHLKEVVFADGNPELYSKLTVFGEHIKNKYGNNVYSIATTSSQGSSKMPYNFEGIDEIQVVAPKKSLEFELQKRNLNFGFIDLTVVKKYNTKNTDKKFNSIMLGHVNQNGKWLALFDGILYIKENEKAIPKD